MKTTDGGPAFPRPLSQLSKEEFSSDQDGMSLRDWFAGMILNGLLASSFQIGRNPQNLAYEMADAMLAEREKQ